ncbi:hypothetical protein BD779DRAFT_1679439 [Infundibulicybe gibba]|nr:hypothetical protein BD779DRAFT_1679439 [Infundibulicybe gibba]
MADAKMYKLAKKTKAMPKRAFWVGKQIIVAVGTNVLPTCVEPADITVPRPLQAYAEVRILSNADPYVAFYPRLGVYEGFFFSRLAFRDDQVIRTGSRYALDESTIRRWRYLEETLLDAATFLIWTCEPRIPVVNPPVLPREHGYRDAHEERKTAVSRAVESRDAFMMLAGYLTFALTLWINDDDDRKSSEPLFEPAFEALRSRETDPFERAWIECLRGSLVHRLGALDVAFSSRERSNLGALGELPSLQIEPRDMGMLNFRPPPGVLEEAKRRAEMIPQRPEASHLASASRVSELPPVPYAEIALDGIEYSQTEYGYNPSGPMTAPPPSLPPLEPSSGQRQGETPLAFIGRMQAQAISHLKHEGEKAKQKRMSHEADAKMGRFVKSASYFEWEQEEGGTWIRKKRIYLSHRHEWDMCSMHNVESAVNDEDSDDDDFGDDEGLDIVARPAVEGKVVMGNEAGGGRTRQKRAKRAFVEWVCSNEEPSTKD